MTPRQGGQDFDLRRARDAPSPGASRSHRQAVPLPMEADPLQATPEVTQQAKTYGSEPVAGNNNGYITAQEFSSQDTSGRMPFQRMLCGMAPGMIPENLFLWRLAHQRQKGFWADRAQKPDTPARKPILSAFP